MFSICLSELISYIYIWWDEEINKFTDFLNSIIFYKTRVVFIIIYLIYVHFINFHFIWKFWIFTKKASMIERVFEGNLVFTKMTSVTEQPK